jgi:hypothetical protein
VIYDQEKTESATTADTNGRGKSRAGQVVGREINSTSVADYATVAERPGATRPEDQVEAI